MKKNTLAIVAKGIAVGASMLVPGVSGGTMAIILGEYDNLVHAVSCLKKDFKKQSLYLMTFLVGGILGVLLFSKLILYLVESFEIPMMYLFLGAVLGSVPMLLQKSKEAKPTFGGFCFAAAGFLIVWLLTLLPENPFSVGGLNPAIQFILMAVAGFIIAVALVLPGISASFMLLVLGLYDLTLQAISQFDILYLLPLAIGAIAGIFLTTGTLETCMKKYPRNTYFMITGFVLGSILEIFPGIPSGLNILYGILTFVAGYTCIRLLGKVSVNN